MISMQFWAILWLVLGKHDNSVPVYTALETDQCSYPGVSKFQLNTTYVLVYYLPLEI